MPLVEVTCAHHVPAQARRTLADRLPDVVSRAVACAEEPYDGDLQPGDVLIRFHEPSALDRFDLDVLIEVRSKWFDDRAADRDRRAELIRDEVQPCVEGTVGVSLALPVAAWSQTGD